MSKHNLGIFYFKKALQENDNVCAQLSTGGTDLGKQHWELQCPPWETRDWNSKHQRGDLGVGDSQGSEDETGLF